jgi:hypothetical protein
MVIITRDTGMTRKRRITNCRKGGMMKLRAYFTLETPGRSPEELKPLWRGMFVPAALAACSVLMEQWSRSAPPWQHDIL